MEDLYSHIVANTYSRETALRRFALLGQIIEAVLYDQSVVNITEGYEIALRATVANVHERAAMLAWGTTWLSVVSATTVQTFLETLHKKILSTPQQVVYVPVALDMAGEAVVGTWCRGVLQVPTLLIDYEIDTTLIAGCGLVIDGHYYDYSFSSRMRKHPHLVRDILNIYATAPNTKK